VKSKHFVLIPVLFLFLYLGIYTWNQRTGTLDNISTQLGLEIVGAVLKPADYVFFFFSNLWSKYIDLIDVAVENKELKLQIQSKNIQLFQAKEDKAEVERLRNLLTMPLSQQWNAVGARVLAGRMGINSVLETIILDRGYLTKGLPGTPLATPRGLVGRILRASATTSTALLIVDPNSRIAVVSQESRAPGILTGRGARNFLELRFVNLNSGIKEGEILVTSGLDAVYPKGMPVARIVAVKPSKYSQFLVVLAEPMVSVEKLEELLLLEKLDMNEVERQGIDKSPTYPVQFKVDRDSFIGPMQKDTFKPVLLEYDLSIFALKDAGLSNIKLKVDRDSFIGPMQKNTFRTVLQKYDQAIFVLKGAELSKSRFKVDRDSFTVSMPKNTLRPVLQEYELNILKLEDTDLNRPQFNMNKDNFMEQMPKNTLKKNILLKNSTNPFKLQNNFIENIQ